ncbi:MAG: NUDIX domain-containing protein [Candidatus Aenigmarchaeota archaeon]|nr:NUDIX domain-containing protein [Candidatus Aenigmarchaeota archaeon]
MDKKPMVGCAVMLMKGNKVLLGKRHNNPEKSDSLLHGEGTWTMPGGGMNFHENPKDCARREAREETGIEVGDFDLISVTNDKVHDAHFVTPGFKCTDFSGEAKIMEPDEIVEWKWFSFDEIPDNLFFPTRKIIENYRNNNILHGDD